MRCPALARWHPRGVFGRAVASVVTAIAILAASVAWAGWVYLHTVADPTRSNRIAHAILDNPAARHELAADISDSLATAANKALASHHVTTTVDGGDPTLQAAVEGALSDPRIAANIVDAITAEHARVLGATPAHPAVIDTGQLVTAVRTRLAPADPELARILPTVAPAQVKLPVVKVPYARQARQWAQRWVHVLALGAVAGLLLGLLIGDRAAVLRRWGIWAIGAAASWAVLPPLAVWAGNTWAKSQAAVIRAVVRGATGGVNAVAVTLGLAGVAAVALSFVLPRLVSAALPSGVSRTRPGGPRAHAVTHAAAAPFPPAPSVPAPQPGVPASPRPATAPRWGTDTWSPTGPRTEEVPVVYDRSGRLAARAPYGPAAAGPASAVAGPPREAPWPSPPPASPVAPLAAPTSPSAAAAREAAADGYGEPPTPSPDPSPRPPGPTRARRPGVSRPLIDPAPDDA